MSRAEALDLFCDDLHAKGTNASVILPARVIALDSRERLRQEVLPLPWFLEATPSPSIGYPHTGTILSFADLMVGAKLEEQHGQITQLLNAASYLVGPRFAAGR